MEELLKEGTLWFTAPGLTEDTVIPKFCSLLCNAKAVITYR